MGQCMVRWLLDGGKGGGIPIDTLMLWLESLRLSLLVLLLGCLVWGCSLSQVRD
jgi:hypothetical protein